MYVYSYCFLFLNRCPQCFFFVPNRMRFSVSIIDVCVCEDLALLSRYLSVLRLGAKMRR